MNLSHIVNVFDDHVNTMYDLLKKAKFALDNDDKQSIENLLGEMMKTTDDVNESSLDIMLSLSDENKMNVN